VKFLSAVLVATMLVSAYGFTKGLTNSKYLIENKAASHYSGCITGFMITIKLGMYKRPSKVKTAQDALALVIKECKKETKAYKEGL